MLDVSLTIEAPAGSIEFLGLYISIFSCSISRETWPTYETSRYPSPGVELKCWRSGRVAGLYSGPRFASQTGRLDSGIVSRRMLGQFLLRLQPPPLLSLFLCVSFGL